MADPGDKYRDNNMEVVEFDGKKISFYVEPQNEKELEECYNALGSCPVEAIGDDGVE